MFHKTARTTKTILTLIGIMLLTFTTLVAVQKEANASNIPIGEHLNHVCSGRTLSYRKHVDAAYLNQVSPGVIDMKVVDGTRVVDADSVCIRLAPDAAPNGDEVSRLAIPTDKQLSFLGKPGEIVWHAPQNFYRGWAPIWSGIGALEAEHEEHPLGDIAKNSVKIDLVEVEGPGEVEIFVYNGTDMPVNRIISSTDERYKRTYLETGSHTHSSTTFTKPGIYRLKWQGHVTLKNGQEISTPIREVIWLVGEDEEVGLPDGTTRGRSTIAKPAEEFAEEIKQEIAERGETVETEVSDEEYTPELPDEWGENFENEVTHITKGHLDLKATWNQGDNKPSVVLFDESDPVKPAQRESNTVSIEVPDSTLVLLKSNAKGYKELRGMSERQDQRLYELPETQNRNLPWLGFNTENIDYSQIEGGVKISAVLDNVYGRMITGNYDILRGDFVKKIDTHYASIFTDTLENPTHVHRATYFTRPGVYTAEYSFAIQPKGQELPTYQNYTVYFMVGNKTINASRKAYNLPLLDEENTSVDTSNLTTENILGIFNNHYVYGDGENIRVGQNIQDIQDLISRERFNEDNLEDSNIIGVTGNAYYYKTSGDSPVIYRIGGEPFYEDGAIASDPSEVVGVVSDGYYYLQGGVLYKASGDAPANVKNTQYGQYWKFDTNTSKYVRVPAEEYATDSSGSGDLENTDTDPNSENNDSSETNNDSSDQNGDSGSEENTGGNTDGNYTSETNTDGNSTNGSDTTNTGSNPAPNSNGDGTPNNSGLTERPLPDNLAVANILHVAKDYFIYGNGNDILVSKDMARLNQLVSPNPFDGTDLEDSNIIGVTGNAYYYKTSGDSPVIYRIGGEPFYEDGAIASDPSEVVGVVSDGYYYLQGGVLYKASGNAPANVKNAQYGQYWKFDTATSKYVRVSSAEFVPPTPYNPPTTPVVPPATPSDNTDVSNGDSGDANGSGEGSDNSNTSDTTSSGSDNSNGVKPVISVGAVPSVYEEISSEDFDRLNGTSSVSASVQPQVGGSSAVVSPFMGRVVADSNVQAGGDLATSKEGDSEVNADSSTGMKPVSDATQTTTQPSVSIVPFIAVGVLGAGLSMLVCATAFLLYVLKKK